MYDLEKVAITSVLGDIPAGATKEFVLRPQVNFRVSEIFVPKRTSRFLRVLDMRVGQRSQFISGESVGAASLATGAPIPFLFDTCAVGQAIIVLVSNAGRKMHYFEMRLLGSGTFPGFSTSY